MTNNELYETTDIVLMRVWTDGGMWTNANAPRFAAGPQASFIAADSDPIHVATLSSTQSGTAIESGPGENPPFDCEPRCGSDKEFSHLVNQRTTRSTMVSCLCMVKNATSL